MKTTFFKLLLVAILSVLVIPSAYAGIPISEQQSTTLTATTSNNVIQEKVSEIQKPAKKAKKSRKAKRAAAMGGKSQIVALLLCIFLGGLGIHRFYLGYIWQGVVQLLTAGGFGIWWLIDLIRIIIGDLTPKNGEYDSTF